MIVISNSSPLIALSRIQQLSIIKHLFTTIYIPESVFQEVVLQSNVSLQKENILKAIDDFIIVAKPQTVFSFKRTLDFGERGVINLAFDKQADFLMIDDKKARKEAKELGFKVLKTSTLLKRAEKLKLISSYSDITRELEKIKIYLPK
jgi:predicted nucleic acid-binding protein